MVLRPQRLRTIRIGTAGWSIPRTSAAHFPAQGTHLQRYAQVMPAVEINSSFYRPHAEATYKKWADSVPPHFRFAVKMPRTITHDLRLGEPRRLGPLITRFLEETNGLGNKRGPLLVQLPPSLEFDLGVARRFFLLLRSLFTGAIVCEPRHVSWFSERVTDLLVRHEVARAAADPVRAPGADVPGGWIGLVYYRLHGSPRTYWSSYDEAYLEALTLSLARIPSTVETWVIFDNTASGAALQNARQLLS